MSPVKIKQKIIAEEEARLLRLVRAKGGLSRVQLAREMRVSPATASTYVDRLVKNGLLLNGSKTPSGGGRPATPLRLNPSGGVFVGASISGNYIRAVCLDFAEEILSQYEEATGRNRTVETVLERIADLTREMVSASGRRLLGAGVAHPGTVSVGYGETGTWRHVRDLPTAPVSETLSRMIGVSVVTETTTHAAAVGELCFGLGRDVRDFVCLSAYTSVGAAIVTGGLIRGGDARKGGDLGGWICPPELLASSAASEVCPSERKTGLPLERLASVWGIVDRVRTAAENVGDRALIERLLVEKFPAVVHLYLAGGNPLVNREVETAAATVGWAAGYLADLVNPQKVIFGGPLAALGPAFRTRAQEGLARHARARQTEPTPFVLSERPFFGAAIGAAAAALQVWTPSHAQQKNAGKATTRQRTR
jgi:predicted NBD/HSP70 family sugar kinase